MKNKADIFLSLLKAQLKAKTRLHDGENGIGSRSRRNGDESSLRDYMLRLATEELGEVASAITRERYDLARAECIDLAHCALLMWIALENDAIP